MSLSCHSHVHSQLLCLLAADWASSKSKHWTIGTLFMRSQQACIRQCTQAPRRVRAVQVTQRGHAVGGREHSSRKRVALPDAHAVGRVQPARVQRALRAQHHIKGL